MQTSRTLLPFVVCSPTFFRVVRLSWTTPDLAMLTVHTAKFNHTQRTWLVIWEAGVVIELPPWVLVLYPSSLLFHFNIDIDGEDLDT